MGHVPVLKPREVVAMLDRLGFTTARGGPLRPQGGWAKMKTYPAIIAWSESDKVFEVKFPDIPGCFTYGETLEDAESFPAALPRSGPDVHEIEPDSSLVFAIWLRILVHGTISSYS
jgi:hypothetical protein